MDTRSIESALDDLHDAALGLTGWGGALQTVTEALGARSCVLIPLDQDLSVTRRLQLESDAHAPFTSIWLDHILEAPDPHTSRPGSLSFERYPTVIEHQITTDEERRAMPYFRSIAKKGNRHWWASIRFRTARRAWAMPLYRTSRQGPFDLTDVRRFDRLIPAIRRSVSFAEAVTEAGLSQRVEALADLGCPALLLDGDGTVIERNREAER